MANIIYTDRPSYIKTYVIAIVRTNVRYGYQVTVDI